MSTYRELLLGCGHTRDKRLVPPDAPKTWQGLVTLDSEEACKPDIVFDLTELQFGSAIKTGDSASTALAGDYFDEIHAYEVLEHVGRQGSAWGFFSEFREYHRLLKPGGYLCGTTPAWNSYWAWSDPGHRRVISAGTLTFLSRKEYDKQLGKTTMSDYRVMLGATDFEIVRSVTRGNAPGETFEFILRAIK